MKALEEDPSVFEYDNIYDEMQEKKKANQRQITKDRSVCTVYLHAVSVLEVVAYEHCMMWVLDGCDVHVCVHTSCVCV